MILDFRHDAPPPTLSRIREEIGVVTEYLGVIIDHKASWEQCADPIKGPKNIFTSLEK